MFFDYYLPHAGTENTQSTTSNPQVSTSAPRGDESFELQARAKSTKVAKPIEDGVAVYVQLVAVAPK